MNVDRNHFVGRERILAEAGVDVRTLGFVGLTLDPLPVRERLDSMDWGKPVLSEDYVYAPEGDFRHWVQGPVAEVSPHVTAKYGLLTPSHQRKAVIDELVGDLSDATVTVTDIEVFQSFYDDLPYGCLVARVGGEWLEEINAELSILPHVDSFPSFKPHITLAYLKPAVAHYCAVPLAADWLVGRELPITGIDYGKVYS